MENSFEFLLLEKKVLPDENGIHSQAWCSL